MMCHVGMSPWSRVRSSSYGFNIFGLKLFAEYLVIGKNHCMKDLIFRSFQLTDAMTVNSLLYAEEKVIIQER